MSAVRKVPCSFSLNFLVVHFTVTGRDVENAVGPVAELRAITATVGFQVIDVFRIKLRSNIAGDVGIGNRNAVDQPTDLVPAANV